MNSRHSQQPALSWRRMVYGPAGARHRSLTMIHTFLMCFFLTGFGLWPFYQPSTAAAAVTVTDAYGRQVTVQEPPRRVVSLVPGATDMLLALGLADRIQGITLHDHWRGQEQGPAVVGGFLAPNLQAIAAAQPDCLLVSEIQKGVLAQYRDTEVLVLHFQAKGLEEIFGNLRRLGEIFQKGPEAEAICRQMQEKVDLMQRKLAKIPAAQRLRVVRLMSDREVTVPGDDSFQNDFIRRAGGIPPTWGKNGSVIAVTPEAWQQFNPQVVFGCGPGLPTYTALLQQPPWRQVAAVRDNRLLNFPCELTCRASVQAADFIAWLAASLYPAEFSDPKNAVLPQEVLSRRPLTLDLPLVRRAAMVQSRILDFAHKTLLLELAAPVAILSTLEGPRQGIKYVGNHYTPPPGWPLSHHRGLQQDRQLVYTVLGRSEKDTSFLFTGADMDNVAIKKEHHRELIVYALATAGVRGNALRLSQDEGRYYEPGTINIIVLSNHQLSPRAMSRALIDITEAKTAALQDLDIRSTEQPRRWQATGTGTDNIIVVGGQGRLLEQAGGHSKLGELIGRAVYAAVREAVAKQNGLTACRPVYQRLQERRVSGYELLPKSLPAEVRQRLLPAWEALLIDPRTAGFLEAALSLSDAWEQGQVLDLGAFETWCRQMAQEVAGRQISPEAWQQVPAELPKPLRLACEALLTGLKQRE